MVVISSVLYVVFADVNKKVAKLITALYIFTLEYAILPRVKRLARKENAKLRKIIFAKLGNIK